MCPLLSYAFPFSMFALLLSLLGSTHPVKNGCNTPEPRSHGASYSGFHFVCSSQAVSVREGAPEELPGVMARLVRGSASCFPRNLLPYEMVCLSSCFGIPRVSQGYPAGIPGEAVLAMALSWNSSVRAQRADRGSLAIQHPKSSLR